MPIIRKPLNELPGQIEALERRMTRVEDALNKILEKFRMPKLEEPDAPKPAEKPVEVVKSGPYVYRPLEASKNEIRVLLLYSSKEDEDPVKCELVTIGLDDDTRALQARMRFGAMLKMFKALSYTWGDLQKTDQITLEGHQFPVTKNLYSALARLRNLNQAAMKTNQPFPSVWWVDAICINQDDVLERNQQVSLMTRIYKKCFAVQIWLGETANNSDLAMELATQIAAMRPRGPGDPEVVYPEHTMDQKVLHWKALTALLQRPWWDRVWIRQEATIPKFAIVQCGGKSCQFNAITNAAQILDQMNDRLGYRPIQDEVSAIRSSASGSSGLKISCYARAHQLSVLRAMGGGVSTKFLDLAELLFHTRSCKATDPRDKAFAVLSMADPEVYEMKPDYRLSVDDTLKTVARCIITKKQSLNLLAGCQNPEHDNSLPSWVPNLLADWKARPFAVDTQRYSPPVTDTSEFTFEGDDKCILRARGRRIDTIASFSDDIVSQGHTPEQLTTLYNKWQALARTAISNPNVESLTKRILEELAGRYNHGIWVTFLSVGSDDGRGMRYSEDGKTLLSERPSIHTTGNLRMVESLLLPKAEDEEAVEVTPYQRIHENLRKYGVGRKLAFMTNGSIGLVPGDAKQGDEICSFKNTAYPYVLRKVGEGEYVVVGESCESDLSADRILLTVI